MGSRVTDFSLEKRQLLLQFVPNNLQFELRYTIFFFLQLHLQHMEVSRLGAELELQLLAYAIATATRDLSRVCDLHYSSRQCWILNPLSEARD